MSALTIKERHVHVLRSRSRKVTQRWHATTLRKLEYCVVSDRSIVFCCVRCGKNLLLHRDHVERYGPLTIRGVWNCGCGCRVYIRNGQYLGDPV